MENLNAEQVKKALECCVKVGGYRDAQICNDCPLSETRCAILLPENALALINSQEQRIKELAEENERLRAEVSVKKKLLDKAEVRIDCLEEVNKVLKADICNATMNLEHITKENERLKADTVRKMQERVKAEMSFGRYIQADQIDQIAKEVLEGIDNE